MLGCARPPWKIATFFGGHGLLGSTPAAVCVCVCRTAGVCAHDCGYDGFAARVYPWLCVLILKKTCTLLHPHPHPGSTQISKTCVDDDGVVRHLLPKLRRDWKSWMRWKLAASLTERGAVDRAAPVITQRDAGGQRTRCSRRPARLCNGAVSDTAAYVRSSQQPSERLTWQPPGGQRASPLGLVSRTAAPRAAAPVVGGRRLGNFDLHYVTLRSYA